MVIKLYKVMFWALFYDEHDMKSRLRAQTIVKIELVCGQLHIE